MARANKVSVAGRVPAEVKDLAELAAEVSGDPNLSQFVGRAVEREARRALIRHLLESEVDPRSILGQ